jgi:signal transduction histidine kinase/CheY-like chemotaxis protein
MTEEILLVDDDPIYRRNIKFLLARDGKSYRFIEAASPAEGIAKLDANPQIRVVLLDLDYNSEAIRGQDLLKHIVDPSSYRVIVLTGHENRLSAEEAEALKVFTYLPKASQTPTEALRFAVDQAFKDLQRVELAKKIQYVQDVQKRINENQSLDKTLDTICEAVLATVEGYTCHIRIVDVNRGDYRINGFAGPPKTGPGETLRAMFDRPKAKGEFFSGRVVSNGIPEFFSDLQHLPEFESFAAQAMAGPGRSEEEDRYWRTVSSAYIVPIKTGLFGDAVDAVLNVSSQLMNFFDKEETRRLVDEFATPAALALTKYWLDLKRHKIHRDYERIGEMLDRMISSLDDPDPFNSIYRAVADTIEKLVHPEVTAIFRLNQWTQRVEWAFEKGGTERRDATVESYGPGQSLTGTVFSDRKTLHIPDPDDPVSPKPVKHPAFQGENPKGFLSHAPSGKLDHYLAVPIHIGGEIQGVLRVINRKSKDYKPEQPDILERGFGTDCRFLLETTARLLAVGIRLAELRRDLNQRLALSETVAAASRLMNETHSVEDLLTVTADQMAKAMQAQIAMLFIKPEGENRVVLRRTSGMDLIEASYELGEGVTGLVALKKEAALIVPAPGNDGKYDKAIRESLPDRDGGQPGIIETLMTVPILAKGMLIGVMKVVNRRGDLPRYTNDDRNLLQNFADFFAVAHENATLLDRTNAEMTIYKRNTAMSTLISAVAREIRNTSGLIPANVAGLRAQLGSIPDAVGRRLDLIERVAAQAGEFADELSGFAMTRRGEKQVLNINDLARNAIAELQRLPPYQNPANIRLDATALSTEPLYSSVYENPFLQIVRNLLINGFEALADSADGHLVVSSFAHGAEAVLLIDDDGPGIPADYESKLYEPEFTTKANGSGIGLWLVKTQLEQIGGRIEHQKKEGKGARFAIIVPRAESTGDQQDATALASSAG